VRDRTIIDVWITKYALTQGILVTKAEHCIGVSEKMIAVTSGDIRATYHTPEWHTSREAAEAHVARMIAAKVKSLDKARKNLDDLAAALKAGTFRTIAIGAAEETAGS
jgi:hypothetical protein